MSVAFSRKNLLVWNIHQSHIHIMPGSSLVSHRSAEFFIHWGAIWPKTILSKYVKLWRKGIELKFVLQTAFLMDSPITFWVESLSFNLSWRSKQRAYFPSKERNDFDDYDQKWRVVWCITQELTHTLIFQYQSHQHWHEQIHLHDYVTTVAFEHNHRSQGSFQD